MVAVLTSQAVAEGPVTSLNMTELGLKRKVLHTHSTRLLVFLLCGTGEGNEGQQTEQITFN
jgi:hypothetical protein